MFIPDPSKPANFPRLLGFLAYYASAWVLGGFLLYGGMWLAAGTSSGVWFFGLFRVTDFVVFVLVATGLPMLITGAIVRLMTERYRLTHAWEWTIAGSSIGSVLVTGSSIMNVLIAADPVLSRSFLPLLSTLTIGAAAGIMPDSVLTWLSIPLTCGLLGRMLHFLNVRYFA